MCILCADFYQIVFRLFFFSYNKSNLCMCVNVQYHRACMYAYRAFLSRKSIYLKRTRAMFKTINDKIIIKNKFPQLDIETICYCVTS